MLIIALVVFSIYSIVKAHPNTLGLIVSVPGLTGPGDSVADISDVFLNVDCISKE